MKIEKIINWEECKLDDICVRIVDGSHNPPKSQSSGYSMLSAKDVFDNKIDFSSPRFLDEASFIEENKRTDINPGDVLLTIVATIGRTAVVPQNAPKFTLQRSVAVIKTLINSHYLCYYFQSQFFQNQLREHAKGTAQKGVYLKTLSNLAIRIAPLNEQNRIVEKLDELLSELEKGKEQLQTSLEQLKVYRQSILKHAFEGKIDFDLKFKKGEWLNTSLSSVCSEITDGSHFSPKAVSDGYPYVTVKDIKNDIIDFNNSLRVSKTDFDKLVYNGCKPNKGDVLFSKDGTVGKVSLIDYEKDFVVLSSIAILRTNIEVIESKLLFYALKSTQFLNQALDQKKGVAIRRIILRDLKNLTLRFPKDKVLQNSLIQYFDSTFESINYLEKELTSRIEQSDILKKSLLQKAFEGKLVEQETTDEPASVLLERIRKEREDFLKAEKERKKTEKPLHIKTRKMAEELKRIIEILKESKEPVSAKTLWQSSTHKDDIDDFYAALKKHIEAGEIIELPRKGKESFLKLADTK